MAIQHQIKHYLAQQKKRAQLPSVRKKIQRLAELNVRSVGQASTPLSAEEEIEREFLSKTLPHVKMRGEIEDLLKALNAKQTGIKEKTIPVTLKGGNTVMMSDSEFGAHSNR